jgi:predicted ferric reductase
MLLVLALVAVWLPAKPRGAASGSYLGQLVGAESVLLLSIGLVLISTLPWVEAWFDGIDRAAIWHRRVAITGSALVLVHLALSKNPNPSSIGPGLGVIGLLGLWALAAWAILPRWQSVVPRALRGIVRAARDAPVISDLHHLFGGYERWRAVHRTTGLFVAAGFVHGVLDGTPFHAAPGLRWSYVAIGGVGLAFYVYRELLARHFMPLHDYEIDAVRPLDGDTVEVALRPLGHRFEFVPGQWAMLYVEGKTGWHRHPFTISSAPDEPLVRVSVKALGDATARAHLAEPGMPAVLGGPHGRFDHRRGGEHQLWIAGGAGVTPFLSWVRASGQDGLPDRVDFFYSVAGVSPFAAELQAAAARHESLHLHVVNTRTGGRLTVERVLQSVDRDPGELTVFMCGPTPMLRDFQRQLRAAGIRNGQIHREYFDWR